MNAYETKAHTTRSRRRKAGAYQRPTRDQQAALSKYMGGCGVQAMSAEECVLLGHHPHLAKSQQQEWIGRAFAKGWS